MKFYIQDTRSYVGDAVIWWRPEGRGYTTNIDEAGLFSAEKGMGLRDTDVMVPQDVVERARKVRVIMAGDLREAKVNAGILPR